MRPHAEGVGHWWSAENDRWIFFGFFLTGVLFILVLKEWVGNQFVVTAVPCALMVAYAVMLWDWDEKRPRSDSAGDNLYYLGFLYTLTSLGHSLFRFSIDREDASIIVTNFGIAIFTTILGMALRILLGRPGADDPAEIEATARADLANAARQLRSEMDYTVEDVKDFRTRIRTTLKSKSLEKAIEHFERSAQTAAHGLIDRAGQLERSAAALTSFEDAATRLHRRTTELEEGTAAVRESLDAQAGALRNLDLQKPLLDAIAPAATKLNAVIDRTADRVGTGIESMLQSIERRANEVAAGANVVSEALQSQAERVRSVDFRQAFLDSTVQPACDRLRETATEFASLLDQLRATDAGQERVLERTQEATLVLTRALQEQRNVAEAVADLMKDARGVAASLQSVTDRSAEFAINVDGATGRLAGVSDEIARWAEQVSVLSRDLTEASTTLTSSVQQAQKALQHKSHRRWFAPWRPQ